MNKAYLSGIINGLLVMAAALLTVLTALPEEATMATIKDVTWIFIVVTGAVAAGKDIQAYLARSPTKQ